MYTSEIDELLDEFPITLSIFVKIEELKNEFNESLNIIDKKYRDILISENVRMDDIQITQNVSKILAHRLKLQGIPFDIKKATEYIVKNIEYITSRGQWF